MNNKSKDDEKVKSSTTKKPMKYGKNYKNSKSSKSNNARSRSNDVGRSSDSSGTSGRDWISTAGKPTNDPAWYMNNPVLSRDAGSLFFSKPTGSPLLSAVDADKVDPGILVLYTMLNWGGVDCSEAAGETEYLANSPINVSAQKLYQFVVHANSRNVSYDKKDLLMSIMAIEGVYHVISEAVRAYRMISIYDPTNLYLDKVITASGWDVDNLRANVAQFRYDINTAIQRVNRLFFPNLFDITKLHIGAYSNIYYDRPSTKAQLILERSIGYWAYADEDGVLDYVVGAPNWPTDGKTEANFRQTVDLMLTSIENSQYLGIMQGDMLKAFSIDAMAQIGYLNIDEPIAPIYDEEFLFKFHNAHVPTLDSSAYSGKPICRYRDDVNVSGNISCIYKKTDLLYSFASADHSQVEMYDLPSGVEPSAENIILMSQHKFLPRVSANGEKWTPDATAVDTDYTAGLLNPDQIIGAKLYWLSPLGVMTNQLIGSYREDVSAGVLYLTRFNVCPRIAFRGAANGKPFMWNTENLLQVNVSKVQDINRVSLWSLWSSSDIANSYREGNTKV